MIKNKQYFSSSLNGAELLEKSSAISFLTISSIGPDTDFFCDKISDTRFRFYSYPEPNTRPSMRPEFYLDISDSQVTITTTTGVLGQVLGYIFTIISSFVILLSISRIFFDSFQLKDIVLPIAGGIALMGGFWFMVFLSISVDGVEFISRLSKELSLKSKEYA